MRWILVRFLCCCCEIVLVEHQNHIYICFVFVPSILRDTTAMVPTRHSNLVAIAQSHLGAHSNSLQTCTFPTPSNRIPIAFTYLPTPHNTSHTITHNVLASAPKNPERTPNPFMSNLGWVSWDSVCLHHFTITSHQVCDAHSFMYTFSSHSIANCPTYFFDFVIFAKENSY